MLTGEEQKGVCQLAVRSMSRQFGFPRSKARCYVSDMNIGPSEIAPGNYDINGMAVLNFDGAVLASTVTTDKCESATKVAAATGSGKSKCRRKNEHQFYLLRIRNLLLCPFLQTSLFYERYHKVNRLLKCHPCSPLLHHIQQCLLVCQPCRQE